MNRRILLLLGLAFGAVASAHAQPAYPVKPIKMIVPANAGGPSDVVARLVGEGLSKALGQTVVVENKPGAAQTLGTAQVAKADPDGYTLLFTTSTPIVMAPFTRKNLSYDVRKDLIAVSHVGTTPLVLYANTTVPVKSVKELIVAAKAKPGELSYGSYGNGSSAHLLGEYLSKQADFKLIHVPYAGVSPQITALVGGQIQFAIADIGVPAPFVKDGKLRPLAVSGSHRSGSLPDVPTFAEQGVTGMEPFSPWWGLFAPAGTPKAVVDKLSAETVKIVKSPEFKARFAVFGADATGMDAAASAVAMNDELARWTKVFSELPNISFE